MKKNPIKAIFAMLILMVAMARGVGRKYQDYGHEVVVITKTQGRQAALSKIKMDMESGNVDLVMGFIMIAVVLAVGVYLLASIDTAMPAVANTSAYYDLQSTVQTTTVSGYGLLVVILILLAAMGLIGTLMVMRGRR
ncbi:MAG: hypothetical protein WC489_07290 [Patescibacteria group bacterium]|jgi:hypothetical protein